MKRIGFVYKYSPSEGKGILVFGTWRTKVSWHTMIKNTPVLFTADDLLSDVCTGQLVYFDMNDNKVSNIERASLLNFNEEFINSLVYCKERESEYSFYYDNTTISFESLDDIIIPQENKSSKEQINNLTEIDDDFLFDDLFEDDLDLFDDGYSLRTPTMYQDYRTSLTSESTADLPESIDNLYSCFGKYKHKGKHRNDSITIDVLDLSFWIDPEILNKRYYGITVEEIKYLYDIFVLRKRYDKNGNEISHTLPNDCISPKWSLILSKFGESDLCKLLEVAPKLQPALPKDFCKKFAGLLSDDYGMPDVEICKMYCLSKISNAKSISEYKNLKEKLNIYYNCGATHLEGEGTPMCKMGKRRINYLKKLLDEQYDRVIRQNVITQFSMLCDDFNAVNELQNASYDVFNVVGLYLESYDELKRNFIRYNVCKDVIKNYDRLPQLYKDTLKKSLLICANESAITAASNEDVTPFKLSYHVELLGKWIDDSTKLKIRELVNERFSNLNDFEDLNYAFGAGYITRNQYFIKYKQITNGFGAGQFLKDLSRSKRFEFPLNIQWYIVSRIIKLLGYTSLGFYIGVKLDYGDYICDIKGLLKYLRRQSINEIILKKAEDRICSVLSNKERWTLFEEKIVQSPGEENIRKHLDKAYKNRKADQKLIKNKCFQDTMLTDVDSANDLSVKIFIVDNLDAKHQRLMRHKATGFLKLYLWQKQPSSDTYDWNLIKEYFPQMPGDIQIRILRYLFGLVALGKFSLSFDTLYSEFVKKSLLANPAIRGILHIIKEKVKDIETSITSSIVESIIGKDIKNRSLFLKYSKELFYPCNGYGAITANEWDIEYLSFNGTLTKERKDGMIYYVISFYETPVNILGRRFEWSDSTKIDTAKQVLVRNLSVDFANNKYYIQESESFFIKLFVMAFDIDDKCGLLSDKERMIEQGYLPRNNVYQPLYIHQLRIYEESDNYVCRCSRNGDSDPSNGIPFFWCQKKICVRRGHFLLPPSDWEYYRFADLLYIALGDNAENRDKVWLVNSEISQFINDYSNVYKLEERNICSMQLDESEDKGTWNSELSTYQDICDYDDDYYDE